MNKFKAGDKVTVKENFWEIKSDVLARDGMKNLAGRTLEVKYVHGNGNVLTKQDESNQEDDIRWSWDKKWLELYTPIITWDNLKWKDVVLDEDGDECLVLDVRNDLVDLSYSDDFNGYFTTYHKQQLQNYGFTIKQDIPLAEKLELTLDQIAEKFGVDVTNIKIKK